MKSWYMKHFVRYIIVFLTSLVVAGCHDELMEEEITGDGGTSIYATLDFKPMSSALARTRAAGDALKDITSLHVLVYDYEKQNLIERYTWKIEGYDVSDENRSGEDAENGKSAETSTRRATFKLPGNIDFGKYYIYAVANIPDLLTAYKENIRTVDGLKSLPLTWDSGDVSANGQMLGCFTRASVPSSSDESVELNEKNVTLHAWLRRAASKVTVAFDGSGLKDGVSIYLKALRIKNIPQSCLLGRDNTVTDSKDIIETGEEIDYGPAHITKDQPFYPGVRQDDGSWTMAPDAHSETSSGSLFFYENKQGKGPDKQQKDANKDGILDEIYKYTDKPYATYIEVDAYYESANPERPGMCNITYRFMLGQDVSTDYDAKRNCHYKLTLRFNGFADEPDWRIDYVTRLWATQPETVDYRGKYFVPDNVSSNQGNNFSGDNEITVTSFMYKNDSWTEREPQSYKIEYRDSGSTVFSETPPDWFSLTEPVHEGNGVYKLKIKYKNPYREVPINDTLSKRPAKDGIHDLASEGGKMNTANCYIVDSKGTYQFPLVYGNAVTDGNENKASYTYQGWGSSYGEYLKTFKNYKDEPISSPYILEDIYGKGGPVPAGLTPSLVWQDEESLVTDIQYVPDEYNKIGGIRFTVGAGIKEGNAVIALKAPDGTVMWSWHIWVTAMDFSRKIILTNADAYGHRNFEIMPVNLGWCSGGTPVRYYDRHMCEVRFTQIISKEGEPEQLGLSRTVKVIQEPHIALPCGNNPYFQWGRKDPFVAGGNADKTTKTWYDAAGAPKTEAPAMMYTALDDSDRVKTYEATASLIRNPDKWQNGPREKTGKPEAPYKPDDTIYFNLWDNSCWDGNDDVIKTVYDPCPAGYHVSSIYTFSGFTDSGQSITDGVETGDGKADITKLAYAATEDNMMPKADDADTEYKYYRDNIVEFYADKTKLISIGFPANGYRDWDDNASMLQYGLGEIWHAQAVPFEWAPPYNAYHLEFTRLSTGFAPHIYPWNNFYATDGFAVRPSKTLP